MARNRIITAKEARELFMGPIRDMTFNEYRQMKSVIQRAINSGQIKSDDNGIDFNSLCEWLNADKVQAAFYIRADILERFKEANRGKNLSYQIQELMAKSINEH